MNTPYHLLTSSASIEAPGYAQSDDGSQYVSAFGTPQTVQCTVQPTSNRDSQRYMRETGTRISTIYLAPKDTSGSATALDKNAKVTVGSTVYRVIGGLQDAAGKGALLTAELEEVV